MNKLFLYLIIIGVLTLVVVSAWEIFQVSSGAKSTNEVTVIEITEPQLISKQLGDHLKADPDYNKFLSNSDSSDVTDTTTQQ